jgi:hypothetical protein
MKTTNHCRNLRDPSFHTISIDCPTVGKTCPISLGAVNGDVVIVIVISIVNPGGAESLDGRTFRGWRHARAAPLRKELV